MTLRHMAPAQKAEPRRNLSADFTATTVRAAVEAKKESKQTITTMQPKGSFFMKKLTFLRSVPGIGLAFAVISTSSVGAYAYANNWFHTNVQTNTSGTAITVTANGCPASLLQTYRDNGTKADYNISTTYKILKPKVITAADIQADQLVTCEERAIDGVGQQAFPTAYDGSSYQTTGMSNGLFYPTSRYGTVQAVRGSTITLSDVPAHYPTADTARDTVTVTVPSDALVLTHGTTSSLADFQPGDQVYVSFQNPTDNPGDLKDGNLVKQSVVHVIAKTQYDYRAKDTMERDAGLNAFSIVKTSDAIGG